MRKVELDGKGEIRFPVSLDHGYPVDPEKAPSYEEALRILKEINYLLSKEGPGSKSRVEKAKRIARAAVDFDVWTSNLLSESKEVFPINYSAYGTFMDPASESYHSM